MEQLLDWDPPAELMGEVLSRLGLARRFVGDLEGARSAFTGASSVERIHGDGRKPPVIGTEYDPLEPPIGF